MIFDLISPTRNLYDKYVFYEKGKNQIALKPYSQDSDSPILYEIEEGFYSEVRFWNDGTLGYLQNIDFFRNSNYTAFKIKYRSNCDIDIQQRVTRSVIAHYALPKSETFNTMCLKLTTATTADHDFAFISNPTDNGSWIIIEKIEFLKVKS